MDFVLLGCHCVLASCHCSVCASWMVSVCICVSGQQHTLTSGRISLHCLPFPVVISAVLFLGHIELICDPLLGGASACDPLLWLASPTTSVIQLRVPGTQPPASQLRLFMCSPAPLEHVESVCHSFYINRPCSDPTASFTRTRLSVRHLQH